MLILTVFAQGLDGSEARTEHLIADFEDGVLHEQSNPYSDGYFWRITDAGGDFTWGIDGTQGSGGTTHSLVMTVTEGVPYFYYLYDGQDAYINNPDLPLNRMSFDIKFPQGWHKSCADDPACNYNFHVGTYHRDPNAMGYHENHNWHFYYQLIFDAYAGASLTDNGWIHVVLGPWPQHQRSISNWNPGVNPTRPTARMFNHWSRAYFTGVPYHSDPGVGFPYHIWLDQLRFYYENDYVTAEPEFYERSGLAGDSVQYPITLRNTHPSEQREFGLLLSSHLYNSDNYWTYDVRVYRDDNGDGFLQPTETTEVTTTGTLDPGDVFPIIVVSNIPASGPGSNVGAYVKTSLVAWQRAPVYPLDPHVATHNTNDGVPHGTPAVGVQITTHVVDSLSVDDTRPAAVDDLSVVAIYTNSVTLRWTAPGGDAHNGTAYGYDVRYATTPITEDTWAQAFAFTGEPAPKPAGADQTYTVPPILAPGTSYYFALKTDDGSGFSAISNPAAIRTATDDVSNTPPTAAFTSSVSSGVLSLSKGGLSPLSVTFNATASSDTDGTLGLMVWDFGDGGWGTGSPITHTYQRIGTHTVTLTVFDDDGASATATHTLTISPGSSGSFLLRNGSGYAGTHVNIIRQGGPDNVYHNVVWANNVGNYGGACRLLVRFDASLPALPLGAHITSAHLRLWQTSNNNGTGSIINLYPIQRDYDPAAVTWNNYAHVAPWEVPGAEGASDIGSLADAFVLDRHAHVRRVWDVTAEVASWYSGSPTSTGFLLRSDDEENSLSRYATPAESDPALWPELEIRYTTNPTVDLELYGTFHAMGAIATIDADDDPDQDATANIAYRISGSGADFQPGHPLSRVSDTRFVGSLFWLDPGTAYDVRVTFTSTGLSTSGDSDGGPLDGVTVEAAGSTRAEVSIPPPAHSYYVAPEGSGTDCTLASPCSLTEGLSQVEAGEEVVLRGGVYYQGELGLFRSGTAGAPIVIRSYAGETAILDGADPATFTWTAQGGGVYSTAINVPNPHLVAAGGQRLFPYNDLPDLQNLYWDLPGFFADGTTLYVRLADDADPNAVSMTVSRFDQGFYVDDDFVYFVNLTFRHYGRDPYAKAIFFNNASDNLVQGCTFALNNTGIRIKNQSRRNVVQDNEFYDTIFDWSWDAIKDENRGAQFLEAGGVTIGLDPGVVLGRGNVIRHNIFHDMFDGFDVCPATTSAVTNETDVYKNTVYRVGDDGMQADGYCSNVRIWGNTFHDVLVGISLSPTYTGPVYALRNVIYRTGAGNNEHSGTAFKFMYPSSSDGAVYLFHNTSDAVLAGHSGLVVGGDAGTWETIVARNNIWAGTHYALARYTAEQVVDFDYDNLYTTSPDVFVKWVGLPNPWLSTLAELQTQTGQEMNGLNEEPGFADTSTLRQAQDIAGLSTSAASGDYRLDASSNLVDAGVILPGINDQGDHAYQGAAPDIGAYEYCTLEGDVDGNGDVDIADVMAVAADWHNPDFDPAHDLDHDGDVDIVDIMLVAVHWGEGC